MEFVWVGVICLGLVFSFIATLRAQSLAAKQNAALMDAHREILDHLTVAANPEAWLAQQADQARKERRAEAKQEASKKTPDPGGIF